MTRTGLSCFGRILAILAVCGLVLAGSSTAGAADFPQKGKAIQMLVGFAAGGSTDVGARLMASGMEKELGTSVVVVNKPGASGQIAYTALTQAKPDGYTIGNTNFPSSVVSYLDPARKATYTRKSFELLALHVIDPALFAVKADSPFKTLKDVVDAAKANPKKVKISTTGIQSDEAFAILQFQKMTGSQFAMVHFAQGVASAMTAFLGGRSTSSARMWGTSWRSSKAERCASWGSWMMKRVRFIPASRLSSSRDTRFIIPPPADSLPRRALPDRSWMR